MPVIVISFTLKMINGTYIIWMNAVASGIKKCFDLETDACEYFVKIIMELESLS